jgi:hypothetical protein
MTLSRFLLFRISYPTYSRAAEDQSIILNLRVLCALCSLFPGLIKKTAEDAEEFSVNVDNKERAGEISRLAPARCN